MSTATAPEAKPPWARGYGAVAVTLHWLIALLIFAMLAIGWRMTDEAVPQMVRFELYQLHKSLGLTILALTVIRIAWRLVHPPPPLAPDFIGWRRRAAQLVHAALYGIMLGLPLTGWAMVSASPWGLPTIVFDLFEWPHIPVLASLENKEPVEAAFKEAHEWLVWGAILLLLLHIAGALKHRFLDREYHLARMLPPLPPR
jgi:cytochrome b561